MLILLNQFICSFYLYSVQRDLLDVFAFDYKTKTIYKSFTILLITNYASLIVYKDDLENDFV